MAVDLNLLLNQIQDTYDSIADKIRTGVLKNITSTNHRSLWNETVSELKDLTIFVKNNSVQITTDSISQWHPFQKGKGNSSADIVEVGDLAFNLRVGDELWPVAEYTGPGPFNLAENWKSKGPKILFL